MRTLKGMRIALIGGAGFIGHNLALQLCQRGAQVSVIDSLAINNFLAFTSTDTNVQNRELSLKILNQRMELLRTAGIPLFIQDCRDYHALGRLLAKNGPIRPQAIIHLAAVAHANISNKDPYSTFDHSLRTLENALDCARDNVEHFIFFSSSMIYGNFPGGFVTEETPCKPIGIYGALKLAGEQMVIAYNQVFGLPYTIIHPSALYGERCVSRRVGQIFIENALQGIDISVAGSGDDRLDFTYIDDLCQGVIKVIEHEQAINQTLNITYGESRSLADMVAILKEHFPHATIKYTPRDKLTPSRGTLSVEKARKLIDYEPQWPLEKGFVTYIEWYKKLFNASRAIGQISPFINIYSSQKRAAAL